MGIGMASQLVKGSYSVMGYDVFPDSLAKAQEMGVTPASSVAEIGANCSTIITMLRTNDQVLSVYDEIFSTVQKNTLLIDSSTVDPSTSQVNLIFFSSNENVMEMSLSHVFVQSEL